MTDNTFDRFVRDKLRDHQSSVPPGLWEKIERKKDKDRKGGFFLPSIALWGVLLFVVAGVGIGYYLSKTDGNSSNNLGQVTETAAAKKGGEVTGVEKNNTPSSSNAGNEDDHTTNTSTGIDTRDNTNNSVTADKNNPDNTRVNIVPRNRKADTDGIAMAPKKKGRGIRNRTPGQTTKNPAKYDSGGNLIGTGSELAAVRKPKTTKRGNNWGSGKDYLFNQDEPQQTITGREDVVLKNHSLLTRGKTAYNLRSLATGLKENLDLSDVKIISIDCPPNGRIRRNDWYLEVYGSPDLVIKSVKSNSNAALVSKKDSTESQQVSYTAGFRISKSIGENLLLKTGLQFSQINERFDLRTENERRIITVVTIRTVQGSTGADSTISDTSTVEQIGYRLQRSYNRYRSIDIPILLSYEFGNENLKFAVNAGAIVNLYSWYSGNTLNDSLGVVSLGSKGTGVYKQNIGVGMYAGFSIIKPVSGKFDLFLEPYFRYNFSNMSRSSGYSQRFNAMGINLGIRYKLKGQRSGEN